MSSSADEKILSVQTSMECTQTERSAYRIQLELKKVLVLAKISVQSRDLLALLYQLSQHGHHFSFAQDYMTSYEGQARTDATLEHCGGPSTNNTL